MLAEELLVPDHARQHRADGQHAQRHQHRHRAFMRRVVMRGMPVVIMPVPMRIVPMPRMRVSARPAFPIERQEHQPPGIEADVMQAAATSAQNANPLPLAQALSMIASFDRNPAKPI